MSTSAAYAWGFMLYAALLTVSAIAAYRANDPLTFIAAFVLTGWALLSAVAAGRGRL